MVRPVLEVRVVREGPVDRDQADMDQADRDQAETVDKAVPVAVEGKGPAAAALARAVVAALAEAVVVVGKNKCGPASGKCSRCHAR